MKASMQASRTGTPKHNDRSFDYMKEDHIDPDRVKDNVYMSYKNLPFAESERTYYKDHYSDWLNEQNAKYRKQGNYTKCRTIRQLLTSPRTRPEEMILQIGNKDEAPSADLFESCVRDYLKTVQQYSSNYHIIDVAIHKDEATPHAHIRGIWDYTDKNGHLHICQGKALDELGIESPNPDLPANSRFNNPKMAIQKEMRETWYDICEDHGLTIDRVPNRENSEHMKIRELIIKRQTEAIRQNEEKLQGQVQELEQKQEALDLIEEEIRRAERELEEKAGRHRAKRLAQSKELAKMLGNFAKDLMPEPDNRGRDR
ncbi:MAG: hypothetical protein LUE86_14235 [Clostridiales bacterium]|nr:hypothetical protein [Clostridiales bacterium]